MIDTSRRYPPQAPGTSEEILGEALKLLSSNTDVEPSAAAPTVKTNDKIIPTIHIDTKTLSLPGDHKPANLRTSIVNSLRVLDVSSVHTIYLHFPDRSVPLSDPISTLSQVVQLGQAKQWGPSNYTLADLREILHLCSQHNWIPPAIFQGEYNALNRQNEDLIHFCHENGMAFYAYSPAAAGVFSPTGSRLGADNPAGQRARQLYGNEKMQAAIQRVRDEAGRLGLGGHEVALRWAVWDGILDGRFGDGVVVGTGGEKQVRGTCEFLEKGGLDGRLRDVMAQVWESVKQ